MKKRVFTRILIVALVCTMLLGLVGFAPMVETAAASAGEQKVAAAANDGGTSGEVKDQPEQEQPTPTPAPTPAPTQEPEPEPTDDPQPGMCKVTIEQPDGGTITCAELPESGQVKAGTKLTFTVSPEKAEKAEQAEKGVVSSKLVAVHVNETALDINKDINKKGEFTVTITKDTTISAEFFGIRSIEVQYADEWTQSKNVTIETIGSVDRMTYQTTDGEAVPFDRSFKVTDEIGEKSVKYTITVNGGGQTAETTVKVSKIDSKAPKAKYTFKNKGNETITGTVTVTDETQISAPVTFTYTGWIADKETPVSSGVLNYNYTKRKYEFTAPRYTKDGKELRYTVSGQDEAGNTAIINDKVGIVCDATSSAAGSNDWVWVGTKSDIRARVFGKKLSEMSKVQVAVIGEETDETDVPYTIDNDTLVVNVPKTAPCEYKEFTYTFSVDGVTQTMTVKYDPDAPVLNPEPTYEITNDSLLAKGICWLTRGLFCKSEVKISFGADDGKEGCGISKYMYYPLARGEQVENVADDAWKEMKDNICSLPNDFTGEIAVKVMDKVGNCTTAVVSYTTEGGVKVTQISNAGTHVVSSDSGDVFAVVARDANGEAYTGAWTKKVSFDVIVNPANARDKDGNSGLRVESVTYKLENETESHAIDMKDNMGSYTLSGVYEGKVTLVAKIVTKEGAPEKEDTPATKPTTVDYQLVIDVKIQDNLQKPVVIIGNEAADDSNGWYNGKDNQLPDIKIQAPNTKNGNNENESIAPYKIEWKLNCKPYGKTEAEIIQESGAFGTLKGVDNNAPDFKKMITDGGPGEYKLTIDADDEAGNQVDTKTYIIKYDATAPMIKADFKDVMQPSANGKYYNIQRVVTISVTDEGFTGTEKLTGAEKITCASGGAEALPKEAWTWKTDHWECQYSYGVASGDARDGDDYKLTVSVTDNAGNTASTDVNGTLTQNKKVDENSNCYTGAGHGNDFTIDQTKPVVSVRFDNNNVRNGKYFSAGRTATITVTEHNFNPKLSVSMTAENATAGADAKEGWTQNGDVWTKTVTFDPQDAVCEFSISVTDLAGNTCTNDEVNYGDSAAHGEFVIDQVNPTLNITGTDASPYADDCAPGFTAHDTNMSAEYTMTLDRTVRASRNENVSDRFLTRDSVSVTGTDINAVFHTITQEAENDGIYVLNVTVMDMAGNSTQTTSTFTVNRHGSFYVFNEALADVVNAKYVQKADGSYQVTEYNASPLVADSVKIEIYRDGQLVTTLTPAIGAGVIGASGLYEYTYDLPAEHFAQNGRYRVALSSVDEAKNESDNTKLDDALLEFTVDSVAPEITMIKGLEKGIVNAKSLDFTASVMDTYGIASVQILVDGKVVKEYVTQEAYDKLTADGRTLDHEYAVLTNTLDFNAECTLLESSSRQHVAIVVTDMAGNVTQTDSKDFAPAYDFHDSVLVSTNFWARYTHNVWALIVTGVVILAVAGGVWYVTAKKKKEQMAA